jgi:hypothetical protein
MANENLDRVWKQFLETAKDGTKKGGNRGYKIDLCKTALKLSDKLIEHEYNTGDRLDLWKEYIGKIYAALEGYNEVIQRMHLSKFSQIISFFQESSENIF